MAQNNLGMLYEHGLAAIAANARWSTPGQMARLLLKALVAFVLIFSTASAAPPGEKIDCTTFGKHLVAGPPERIYLRGFSILTPAGNWCTAGPNLTSTTIQLSKVTEYGKTAAEVTPEEDTQTFLIRSQACFIVRSPA
jgi:hypothetical protein